MTERTPRRRPSPALLLAGLALFVALGGPAAAQDAIDAAKQKITGKQIANGTITAKKLKSGAVTSAKLKDGTIQAKDIRAGVLPVPVDAYPKTESDTRYQSKGSYQPAGSYLAADGKAVDADKLDGTDLADLFTDDRKARNADELDGLSAEDFQQGSAAHGALALDGGESATLLNLPGRARLEVSCVASTPDDLDLTVHYLAGWAQVYVSRLDPPSTTPYTGVISGSVSPTIAGIQSDSVTVTLQRFGSFAGSQVIEIDVYAQSDNTGCLVTAIARERDDRLQVAIPTR
jgi:hypothetical protein